MDGGLDSDASITWVYHRSPCAAYQVSRIVSLHRFTGVAARLLDLLP